MDGMYTIQITKNKPFDVFPPQYTIPPPPQWERSSFLQASSRDIRNAKVAKLSYAMLCTPYRLVLKESRIQSCISIIQSFINSFIHSFIAIHGI